jgi:hypothetical protein
MYIFSFINPNGPFPTPSYFGLTNVYCITTRKIIWLSSLLNRWLQTRIRQVMYVDSMRLEMSV